MANKHRFHNDVWRSIKRYLNEVRDEMLVKNLLRGVIKFGLNSLTMMHVEINDQNTKDLNTREDSEVKKVTNRLTPKFSACLADKAILLIIQNPFMEEWSA